ncbi:MAG: hypothetical protein Q8M20_12550 [Rhodocyclaceae bacterium]|nr:hypothetical protein [Rhodocyclaceae bacterium]MDZ4213832.1 hypothetical protein [Rhodocyclaceae bacterium]
MKQTPAALLTILAALCVAPAQAQSTMAPVGRLFFAPEMRVQLERQRQLNLQESRSLEAGTIRLDGIVVRSSGKSTVWVNNQDTRATGVVTSTSRKHPGQATLITGNEAPADLKVGVTLDRATRETSGGLAGGEIRVRPGK